MEYQLPNDDPPKSLPTLTKEQKQKGIIALQESLNRSNMNTDVLNLLMEAIEEMDSDISFDAETEMPMMWEALSTTDLAQAAYDKGVYDALWHVAHNIKPLLKKFHFETTFTIENGDPIRD